MLGGCSVIDRLKPGSGPAAPETTAATGSTATATAAAGGIDPRRYIGPDYCPEIRVHDGAQLIRTYERGHQDEKNFVKWQASFAKTARECLYDMQGGVVIKVGVSGRVVSGPKYASDPVNVPVRIVIVKNKEAVLATDRFAAGVTIPAAGSTVFSEVRNFSLPSPAQDRDYIIYVGFDVGNWDPMKPAAPSLVAQTDSYEEPEPEPAPAPPPRQPAKPKTAPPKTLPTPNELPVPSGGFVLSQ
jgi:hypothetical protein